MKLLFFNLNWIIRMILIPSFDNLLIIRTDHFLILNFPFESFLGIQAILDTRIIINVQFDLPIHPNIEMKPAHALHCHTMPLTQIADNCIAQKSCMKEATSPLESEEVSAISFMICCLFGLCGDGTGRLPELV